MVVSIGSSFTMAVSTLVAQASGANNSKLCRVYLNRQYFLNTVLFAVLCIPFLFIKQIYIKIGQGPEISALAAQYA